MMRRHAPLVTILLAGLLAGTSFPVWGQDVSSPEQEENEDANIIVTGSMRVRQGGAQDIRHFRAVAEDGAMPRPESLTVEGLMGEHDLALEATRPCDQLLCLDTEAMPAAIVSRPEDRIFVGLTFGSNIDAATWTREPLNLVAVVDKSGSMSGEPLELVRRSLRQITGQLRDGDQLSIILYGDRSHVHLGPTPIAGSERQAVLAAIDAIESAGSTNMEEGLQVGYATAFASAPKFRGNTRMMLFTDEQPNVGATDAGSFMGMAEAASRRRIGLTTIGVGVQFDGALAAKISSVRGGNLFFMSNEEEVKTVFEKQLDTMVSELAHDVRISLKPREGHKITGIFGVPDGLMTDVGEGEYAIIVPTAFLSTNGGGIFVSVGKAGSRANLPAATLAPRATLLEIGLDYVAAKGSRHGSDRLVVGAPAGDPSPALRRAHLLVDEYATLKQASIAFHRDGDPKAAFRLLSGFQKRLDSAGLDKMEGEKTLVAQMLEQASLYSGYGGEQPRRVAGLGLVGTWRVSSVDGIEDLAPGDRLVFTEDELRTERRTARPSRDDDEYGEVEDYKVEANRLLLPESKLAFAYRLSRTGLTLASDDGAARMTLRRIEASDGLFD
jgi:Ca-activated chloride channel family protein